MLVFVVGEKDKREVKTTIQPLLYIPFSLSLPLSLSLSLSPLLLCFQTGTSLLGSRRCGLGCSGRNNEPLIEG